MTFEQFESAFHAHFTQDPNARVFLGVTRDLGELPDPSLAHQAARVAGARALLAAAQEVEPAGFDQRLDLELAALQLEHQILMDTHTFNGRTHASQCPRAGDDIGDGVFMLFINDPRPASERLTDVLGRLQQVPAYLDAMIARLDTPLKRWVAIDLEKVGGLSGLFDTVVGWSAEEGFARHDELVMAQAVAVEAIAEYSRALSALPTSEGLHLGRELAQEVVRTRGIALSLEELHAVAPAFLAGNEETIEALRAKLVARYGLPSDTDAEGLQQHLAKLYRVKADTLDDVLQRYQAEREKILGFIRERGSLFPIPADQDMKIMRTPKFMEPSIPAGAMMEPVSFREGTRTSMVYLTLSEELLDEHTELSIPGMMIHEGIPGHHLQLATASLHSSVVRRHGASMDHCEGWTTMLEDYMLDVGYVGELADEVRFVGKRDINRIGARIAIDLYFMTGDKSFLDVGVDCDLSSSDPFEAAASLLFAVTGFVPGRLQAELNWYSQERGYSLSYLAGNHLVWQLKRDIIAHNQGTLEGMELDRAFHKVYLESGNMPVRFLRRVCEEQGLVAG